MGNVEPIDDRVIEELVKFVEWYKGKASEISTIEELLNEKEAEASKQEKLIHALESELSTSGGDGILDADTLASYEADVKKYDDAQKSMISSIGAAEAKTEELNRIKGDLIILETAQEQAEKKLRARKILETIKTVMHRSAIPHDLSSLYVNDVNKRLETYCERLRAPFTLFVHPETLRFMSWTNGTAVPVSQLSGGQATVAAWAWHLSLYEKHGQSFGMLAMDEPTVGVDETNMENLAETVQYLNDYCAGVGIQLLVNTHEQALVPTFNHRVDIK